MVRHHAKLGLKAILAEASDALARLDSERLEQMALYCGALVDGGEALEPGDRSGFEAVNPEMRVFARILEETRANLRVMRRLREVIEGKLEYSPAADCRRDVEFAHGGH